MNFECVNAIMTYNVIYLLKILSNWNYSFIQNSIIHSLELFIHSKFNNSFVGIIHSFKIQ